MKPRDKSGAPASPAPVANPAAERDPLDWARDAGEADRVIAELDQHLRKRRRKRVQAAVTGAVALLAGVLFVARSSETGAPAPVAAAEIKVLRPAVRALADGSTVELKGDAEIVVELTEAVRRVVLRKGAAHFQVAHDARRPFVVVAGGVEVRAVGTAFAVEVDRAFVDVVVTEGTVAVERPTAGAPAAAVAGMAEKTALAQLTRGWSARIELPAGEAAASPAVAPNVAEISSSEMTERLAWRVPRLEFAGTPLDRALAMFNQHAAAQGRKPLALGDASLGKLRLSGVLRADNAESLLRLLEGEFGLTAEHGADRIVIRQR